MNRTLQVSTEQVANELWKATMRGVGSGRVGYTDDLFIVYGANEVEAMSKLMQIDTQTVIGVHDATAAAEAATRFASRQQAEPS